MTNYENWSLEDLKSAAADLDMAALNSHSSTFFDGGQALQSIGDSFSEALSFLAGGWKGDAAQGAATSAQSSISTVTDTQGKATQGHDATEVYAFDLRSKQQEVAAVPDVDTGWGHAIGSGALGGLGGIAYAKYKQHEEYEKNRAKAAKLVAQIDSRGKEQASTMTDQHWPTPKSAYSVPEPLQPPGKRSATGEHTTGGAPATGDGTGPAYPGSHVAASHATASVAETSQHHGHTIGTISGPHGGSVAPTSAQPLPSGVAPASSGPAVEAAAAAGGPGLVGSTSIGAGAAAVAGGAALLGGGPLAGRPSTVAGPGSRGSLAGGRPGGLGRDGIGRNGESGRPASEAGRAGRAPLEGRAGSALPGEAERAGTFGRAAASEAAGRGGAGTAYPPGGAGRGANDDDDELRARPEWLTEQDDIWGDGRLAAPPVLG